MEQFHLNPTIDPKTGKLISIGDKQFKKLTAKYGHVKIISPVSGHKITVGKGEYNKLINPGYTEAELLGLASTETKQLVFNSDIWQEILMQLSIDELKHFCYLNQHSMHICSNIHFWKAKYEHDDLPFLIVTNPKNVTVAEWIKEYETISIAYQTAKHIENYICNKLDENDYKWLIFQASKCMFWLPSHILKIIHQHKKPWPPILSFEFNNNIVLKLIIINEMNEELIEEMFISSQTFIEYLTKLFYYYPEIDLTTGCAYVQYQEIKNLPLSKLNKEIKSWFDFSLSRRKISR